MENSKTLNNLNKELFLDAFAKQLEKDNSGLKIIFEGGKVNVWVGPNIEITIDEFRPELYHNLKTICHLFAAFFIPSNDRAGLKEKIIEYKNNSVNLDFPNNILEKFSYLDSILEKEKISPNMFQLVVDLIDDYLKYFEAPKDILHLSILHQITDLTNIASCILAQETHEIIQFIQQKLTEKYGKEKILQLLETMEIQINGKYTHRPGDAVLQYCGRKCGKSFEELSKFPTGWEEKDPAEKERKKDRHVYFHEVSNISPEKIIAERKLTEKLSLDVFGNPDTLFSDIQSKFVEQHLIMNCAKKH